MYMPVSFVTLCPQLGLAMIVIGPEKPACTVDNDERPVEGKCRCLDASPSLQQSLLRQFMIEICFWRFSLILDLRRFQCYHQHAFPIPLLLKMLNLYTCPICFDIARSIPLVSVVT